MDFSQRQKNLNLALKYSSLLFIQTNRSYLQEKKQVFAISADENSSEILNLTISCLIITIAKKTYVLANALQIFDFLNSNEMHNLKRQNYINLRKAFSAYEKNEIQFSLMYEENQQESAIRLEPRIIIYDKDHLKFFKDLLGKNPHLLFSNETENNDNDIIRNISFILLACYDNIPNIKDDEFDLLSGTIPELSQNIYTLGSPFGVLSSEIYRNLLHKGVISNVFKVKTNKIFDELVYGKYIFTIDALNFNGNEGAIVLDEEYKFLGIVLPSLLFERKKTNYVTFAINLSSLFEILLSLKNDLELFNNDESNIELGLKPINFRDYKFPNQIKSIMSVCQLLYKNNWASGILLNKKEGLILSVAHLFDRNIKIENETILVKFPLLKKIFKAKIIEMSKGSFDLSLLKINDPQFENNQCQSFLMNAKFASSNVSIGTTAYAIGFGYFAPFSSEFPLISKGIVSKVIKDRDTQNPLLIQSDCSIYNGFSGGGLFNDDNEVIGIIIFNIKDALVGEFEKMNFSYFMGEVRKMLDKESNKFDQKHEFLEKLSQLQTREYVPIYKISSKF